MTFRVIKDNNEIELFISRKPSELNQNAGIENYVAKNENFPNDYINFSAKNNKVIRILIYGNFTIFKDDLGTSMAVIEQRIQDALTTLIEIEGSGLDETKENTVNSSIKPYDPDKIKVRQDKFAVEYVVHKLIKKGILDLNTDFQRMFVWDRKRQSRLIESIMLGIPIPLMYLSESNDEKFHVVDGLQRLSTFKDYLNGEFALSDLEHLTDYEGCYFDDKAGPNKLLLDSKMSTRIETYQLYFNVIEKSSPDEVKYDIFERLNTGGLPLNAQEIRNCNAEVNVREFLKKCAYSEQFINATGKSVSKKRMDDQELILRFVGFYLHDKGTLQYSGNMRRFLDSVNEFLNRSDQKLLDQLYVDFLNSMDVCLYLFGIYAFRKCTEKDLLPNARKPNINKAMFVVFSVLTTKINYETLKTNYPEGYLIPILADKMIVYLGQQDGQFIYSEYYDSFTTGTFDLKTITSSLKLTKEFLNKQINSYQDDSKNSLQ
jgi:hypothetical protein